MSEHRPLGSSFFRPPKPFEAEVVKKRGWQDQGILVVAADDHRLSWPERELIKQIGKKLFGERSNARAA